MLFSSLGPEILFLSHNQVLWFGGFGDHLAVAGWIVHSFAIRS